jgi:hypothetical protein
MERVKAGTEGTRPSARFVLLVGTVSDAGRPILAASFKGKLARKNLDPRAFLISCSLVHLFPALLIRRR